MAVKYTASGGSGDRAGGVDYETYEGQTAMLMVLVCLLVHCCFPFR